MSFPGVLTPCDFEKYNLIKDIVNKSDLIKLMSKEFASQFEGYMSKGPY